LKRFLHEKGVQMTDAKSQEESPTTSFVFDKRTMDVLDRLKGELGASSRVDVIRRALALLSLTVEGSGGKPVTVQTKDGPLRIAL
jgi:hypothetical protein